MGVTSKPLAIMIDRSVYEANQLGWMSLQEQGHQISVLLQPLGDIVLAPYAMRMTGDMLLQLPSAFTLAIKGARELRYATTTKGTTTWKGKSAQAKKPRQRRDVTVKTQALDCAVTTEGIGGSPPSATSQGTGGTAISPVGDPTNIEGLEVLTSTRRDA